MFDYGTGWLLLGILLVLMALADALWTTLTVSGAGWLSSKVANPMGGLAMRGPKVMAENASIIAFCTSFVLWALLLWFGWALVFSGSSRAVVDATTLAPATLVGRFYFAGYTLTTLGLGDLKPEGPLWRIATVLAAASGFVVLTLFVTYSFSVITALNGRRALGAAVGHLGTSPEAVVLLLKDGGEQALTTRLLTLTDQLEHSAMQTDAYPVLEYSHVSNPHRSFARGVVTLGEVTMLLQHAMTPEHSLPAAAWKPLRQAVDLMIGEKHDAASQQQGEQAPQFDFDWLAARGIGIQYDVVDALNAASVRGQRQAWQAWLKWHGRGGAHSG